MPPLTALKEGSLILRLPAGRRTEALDRISANANAPGGCKRQINRACKPGPQRMAGTMGIYPIESNRTAANAYDVGGATPVATITVEAGTPGTTAVATTELDPVTFSAPAGVRNLTIQISNTLAGNAKVSVP